MIEKLQKATIERLTAERDEARNLARQMYRRWQEAERVTRVVTDYKPCKSTESKLADLIRFLR